jgi:DNA-binding MarR family transcriptional regulator
MARIPDADKLARLSARFPEIDVAAVMPYLSVVYFVREAAEVTESNFTKLGISYGRFIVLVMLLGDHPDGMSPAALADAAFVTRGTMTGLLDALERDGHIARSSNAGDKRMTTVHLTRTGLRFIEEIAPGHFARISVFMKTLTREEKKTLTAIVDKMRRSLGTLRA